MSYVENLNPNPSGGVPEIRVGGPPLKLTPGAKALCILFLIFGILGILACVSQGISLFFSMMLMNSMQNPPPELQNTIQQMNASASPVGIALMVLSAIGSIAMTVGGAVGLARKRWGAQTVRFTSLYFAFHKLAEGVFQAINQSSSIGMIEKQFEDQMASTPDAPPMAATIFRGFLYGSIAVGWCILISLVCFYLFSFKYMSKRSTLDQFS